MIAVVNNQKNTQIRETLRRPLDYCVKKRRGKPSHNISLFNWSLRETAAFSVNRKIIKPLSHEIII